MRIGKLHYLSRLMKDKKVKTIVTKEPSSKESQDHLFFLFQKQLNVQEHCIKPITICK